MSLAIMLMNDMMSTDIDKKTLSFRPMSCYNENIMFYERKVEEKN